MSPMHRDYGVSLVRLLRGIARKIDESYAQELWGKFIEAIERYSQKIDESYAQELWGKFSEAIERYCQKDWWVLCTGIMGLV